ncbi:hypothetical protein [Sodalis praecaptivus]|uniref:hypothetical protein n=1 Tax=Sodalis praecaptivus TaxID=1239307 RepID=UPI0031F8FE2D
MVETMHSASENIMAYDRRNGTTFFKYDVKALAKRVYDKTAIVAQGALSNRQALL